MTTESLKNALQKLHATLESGAPVDEKTKELLRDLDSEIQGILAKTPEEIAEQPNPDNPVSLVQSISANLAARHPHLEPVVREIATTLTNMGI
ncbi:DUF4404 family protein [Glaciimonas soli]|uniref:DUF4404 family protein n=1 Tax=Glaciimonas soli TaxID=2590999 RepID=A0A843YTL0_9BURK|nr:DUF4404 family protein [Glaciimonas soli]MQR00943.1 DUF4404 family protein [Glaciimonas soli]